MIRNNLRSIRPGKYGQFGFTLLEVLIVVAIFSVISVICLTTITRYIDVNERLEERDAEIKKLDRFFLLLDQDLRYSIPVFVDSASNGGTGFRINFGNGVIGEVIRAVVSKPGYDATGLNYLKQVIWQHDGDNLYRYVNAPYAVDVIDDSRRVLILEDVKFISVEDYYWSDDYGLQAGSQNTAELLPAGVRFTIETGAGIEYEKLIDIANGT